MEWTASAIRPASIASSSSLVNRPLPPASVRVRSWMRSPEVTMGVISKLRPGLAAARASRTSPVWTSDSGEPRAPM